MIFLHLVHAVNEADRSFNDMVTLHSRDTTCLVTMCCPFYILLDSTCEYFEKFFHIGYWPEIFFSGNIFCQILVCRLYALHEKC